MGGTPKLLFSRALVRNDWFFSRMCVCVGVFGFFFWILCVYAYVCVCFDGCSRISFGLRKWRELSGLCRVCIIWLFMWWEICLVFFRIVLCFIYCKLLRFYLYKNLIEGFWSIKTSIVNYIIMMMKIIQVTKKLMLANFLHWVIKVNFKK